MGDILSLLKSKYPNHNLNFYDFDNNYIKHIIDNKETVLIKNVKVLPTLTDKEKHLIKILL